MTRELLILPLSAALTIMTFGLVVLGLIVLGLAAPEYGRPAA